MDRSAINPGEEWPNSLREGLLASRVIVALVSRSYLASKNCGRELEVFRRRLAAYPKPADGANPPAVILPIIWDTPALLPELPPALENLQYSHADLGENYRKRGLRVLASLSRNADDYREFVDAFAERIVAVATPNALPRVDIPPIGELPSAFADRADDGDGGAQAAPVPNDDTAYLVFVVGTAAELEEIRQDVSRYATGEIPRWWPFRPSVDKPIHILANIAMAHEYLFPELVPVTDDLIERLREAEQRQTVVLVIVDPWSARVERCKQFLGSFDEQRMINAELLVLSSAGDEETTAECDRLRDELRGIVYRTVLQNSGTLPDLITTPEAFQQQVIAAVNEVRKRLMQVGRLRPVARGSGRGSLPLVTGPGGS